MVTEIELGKTPRGEIFQKSTFSQYLDEITSAIHSNRICTLAQLRMTRGARRLKARGGALWKIAEEKSPKSSLQPSWLQMHTDTCITILQSFQFSFCEICQFTYVSLAPTDAVAGAAHPMAAWLWNLPMGLAVVEAASLEPRSYRGVPLCEVSHLTVESSAGVGEIK